MAYYTYCKPGFNDIFIAEIRDEEGQEKKGQKKDYPSCFLPRRGRGDSSGCSIIASDYTGRSLALFPRPPRSLTSALLSGEIRARGHYHYP